MRCERISTRRTRIGSECRGRSPSCQMHASNHLTAARDPRRMPRCARPRRAQAGSFEARCRSAARSARARAAACWSATPARPTSPPLELACPVCALPAERSCDLRRLRQRTAAVLAHDRRADLCVPGRPPDPADQIRRQHRARRLGGGHARRSGAREARRSQPRRAAAARRRAAACGVAPARARVQPGGRNRHPRRRRRRAAGHRAARARRHRAAAGRAAVDRTPPQRARLRSRCADRCAALTSRSSTT